MPILDVRGVQINFPFEPYPCQLDYMGKVIESLQKSVNGVLESPTGTGKTLCLLCSSLAWQESVKAKIELNKQVSVSSLLHVGGESQAPSEKGLQTLAKSLENATGTSWGGSDFALPKIIYASRTHSQLSQVIQELKRTAYNTVKVSVIGSRDQLCIHEQVKKETNNTNKVHMCRSKVQNRTCYYYNHFEALKKNSEVRTLMSNVVDIEDLVGYGQKNKVCPYYMARDLKGDADITFMPYNYLLDPKTRKHHGVELQGSVIIFDEAHNLEQICEDNSSFDLKAGDLATAIEETTKIAQKLVNLATGDDNVISDMDGETPSAMEDFNLDELIRLKSTLKDLEDQIDAIEIPNKGLTKPGIFMFELLAKANIVFGTKGIIVDLLDRMVSYISTDPSGAGTGITKGAGLSKVAEVLKIIFSREPAPEHSLTDHQKNLAKSYKVHIHREEPKKKNKTVDLWATSSSNDKSGKTVSYWCFSPGHSMHDLKNHGVKCIILTSGTLSPISSFTAEMQIEFPVTLENPHVIQKHQVMVGTLNKGPDGVALNSSFKTRSTPEYQGSLGNCIVNFSRVVPNGLLIFFPSYPVMEKCLEMWKENNIWNRIEQYKQIFVEPRSKGVLNDLMNDFYSKINDPTLNGAIFIAVCRGKVSEGLDFSDINGRAVVITGLPYPPYLDPKVVLKMQYLDEMKGKQGYVSLSGSDWYKQQASRAVNQAIGRVIRHKEDFGAIMLCDERFSYDNAIRQLPVWVRPHVKKYTTFGQAMKDSMVFFKTAEKAMPAPKPPKNKGAGSGGAYFMPTATRTNTAGPAQSMPAHMVAHHVPSLKARDEVLSADRLREHYRWTAPTTSASSSSSQKSLFDALDNTQSTQSSGLSETQIPSYQPASSKADDARKPQAKKKIVIKKRTSEEETEKAADKCTEVSSKVNMAHVNSAEDYIAEVKSTLSREDYRRFSTALVEYKKIEDIDKVCAVLADLFTDKEQHYHLLAKFYRFVRSKHKMRFHEVCLELTGIPVYKPQDSVNKKRLQDQSTSAEDVSLKRQKTLEDKIICDKTNTAQDVIMKSTSGNAKDSKTCCLDTQTHLKGLDNLANTGVEKRTRIEKSAGTDKVDSKAGDCGKECGVADSSPADSCNAVEPGRTTPKSGYTCSLCSKDAQIPFKALCGHACCMTCWREVFEGSKLCPSCGQRVRRRHLTRLLFRMEAGTENQAGNVGSQARNQAVNI